MTGTFSIVPYQPPQESAVLTLWNRTIADQFPMRRRLFLQQTRANPSFRFDDAAVAWVGDEPVGFVLTRPHRQSFPTGERYQGTGALSVLLVRPDARRQGIGSALLDWAHGHLRRSGALQVRLGAGLEHTFPGVPTTAPAARSFFEHHGYRFTYEVSDLILDLRQYQRPAKTDESLRQAGPSVTFGPCQPGEEQPLLDFVTANFPGSWWYWTDRRLAAGDREYLYLMRHGSRVVGFAHLYSSRARVIGPSIFWAPRLGPRYGGLGPIGLAEDLRGRGLGLALLCRSLEHLRHHGVRRTVVDWTDLPAFYAQVGFRVWQSYWMSAVRVL